MRRPAAAHHNYPVRGARPWCPRLRQGPPGCCTNADSWYEAREWRRNSIASPAVAARPWRGAVAVPTPCGCPFRLKGPMQMAGAGIGSSYKPNGLSLQECAGARGAPAGARRRRPEQSVLRFGPPSVTSRHCTTKELMAFQLWLS